ncbi:hypothetical protein AB3X21_17475, partial [Roseomonas mucosa]
MSWRLLRPDRAGEPRSPATGGAIRAKGMLVFFREPRVSACSDGSGAGLVATTQSQLRPGVRGPAS